MNDKQFHALLDEMRKQTSVLEQILARQDSIATAMESLRAGQVAFQQSVRDRLSHRRE